MTVNMDQIVKGVSTYYETELASKTSGVGQFAAFFILPSIPGIVRSKLQALTASPFAADMVTPDGLVDLDAVRNRAQTAMQKCGSVEVMGFRLNNDDISRLYEYIRRA